MNKALKRVFIPFFIIIYKYMTDEVFLEKDLNRFKKAKNSEVIKKLMENKALAEAFNRPDEKQSLLDTMKRVARGRRITPLVMKEIGWETLKEAKKGQGGPINTQDALAWVRKYGIRYGRETEKDSMPKTTSGSSLSKPGVSSAKPVSSPRMNLKF